MIIDGEHNAVAQEGELRDDSHHGKAGWPSRPSSPFLTLNSPANGDGDGDGPLRGFLPAATPQLASNLGKTANRRPTRLLTHAR
jgi:hypothetical protein